jgi:hypothetical protein
MNWMQIIPTHKKFGYTGKESNVISLNSIVLIIFNPAGGDSMFVRNIKKRLPDYTMK